MRFFPGESLRILCCIRSAAMRGVRMSRNTTKSSSSRKLTPVKHSSFLSEQSPERWMYRQPTTIPGLKQDEVHLQEPRQSIDAFAERIRRDPIQPLTVASFHGDATPPPPRLSPPPGRPPSGSRSLPPRRLSSDTQFYEIRRHLLLRGDVAVRSWRRVTATVPRRGSGRSPRSSSTGL